MTAAIPNTTTRRLLSDETVDEAYGFLLAISEGGGGLAGELLKELWPVHATAGEAEAWRNEYAPLPRNLHHACPICHL